MQVSIERAKQLLLDEQVLALPTDTIWGLAALVSSKRALEKLLEMKAGRSSKAFVVQLAKLEDLHIFCEKVPDLFTSLAKKHWPGPLTLVCKAKKQPFSFGLESIAFRIPKHDVALSLLEALGPLLVSSANPSSEPPAQTVEDLENYFGKDLAVLGDEKISGKASTVAFVEEAGYKILRQGELFL